MYDTCKWTFKSILRDDMPYDFNVSVRIGCEYFYHSTPVMARLRRAPVSVSEFIFPMSIYVSLYVILLRACACIWYRQPLGLVGWMGGEAAGMNKWAIVYRSYAAGQKSCKIDVS